MSLLPRSPDIVPDTGPRVVGVDSEAADDLMAALSSETARRILVELHEDPAPPAELADRADTTLQNAQYHLGRLDDAGAIDVVGTAYSEKGREMDVYAPADQPLVIFAGREESASGLKAALSRLLGGLAALALGSLAVQELFGRRSLASFLPFGPLGESTSRAPPEAEGPVPPDTTGGFGGKNATTTSTTQTTTPTSEATTTPSAGQPGPGQASTDSAKAGDAATPAATGTPSQAPEPSATETATEIATETATEIATETAANVSATPEATRSAAETAAALPPGLLFFLGGALVLTVGIAVTYAQR